MRNPVVCASDGESRQEQHLVRASILCCKCSVCCLDASTSSELVCACVAFPARRSSRRQIKQMHTLARAGLARRQYISSFRSAHRRRVRVQQHTASSSLCLAPISCVLLLSCLRAGQVNGFYSASKPHETSLLEVKLRIN
jgi:hypothetical protein